MTTGQAADHFGVSVKTIQRWAATGKLKADRIDGRWFISLNGNDNDTNKPDNDTDKLDNDTDKTDEGGLRELLARADSEISHLREQLDRRDRQIESMSQQIDHLSQLFWTLDKMNGISN